ncbi:MAG: hypothetical protein COS47_00680 [Candidatus Nealsonbacteria bacterium CG03_land_8_20_14_0_80_36_12]|uniref:Uncharacterized protein n=1 Tax=Candidatus Nealsonbacteria bacterium CG03_land_8_20_14_0_80_36_12 TaxID=1974701 RepID=A0A2M7BYT5_9BACT|nr:MAG: hypothetical protein COS47_00680 [Candidatus Nealsonbacteria bacterium CG03_land_8_20_14_0_80_36_12]
MRPEDIFKDKKKEISRRELREKLRKAPGRVPGSSQIFSWSERVKMEKEIFGRQYGSYISDREFKRRLRLLEREKYRVKTQKERLEVDRKIRLLRKLGKS